MHWARAELIAEFVPETLPRDERTRRSAHLPPCGPAEFFRGVGLSTLSGVTWFLACPPFDLWLLAWVAMVPLLFAIDQASSTRRAVWFSFCAGMVANGGGFYWLVQLLGRFAGFPQAISILIFLVFCAYQASILVLFGWTVRILRRRTALPMMLIAPPAIVTFELLIPLLFPYHLAITQAWHPVVIQIADVTGPLGVTALLILVNAALYDLMTNRWKAALAGAVLLVAALVYGKVRMTQVDQRTAAAPHLKVGVVQPNIAYNAKGVLHPEQAEAQLATLQQQSRKLEAEGAQLIVWSEGSYPHYVPIDSAKGEPAYDYSKIREGFETPVVVGAMTYMNGQRSPYNSALLLDAKGQVAGRYDKVLLLTFGERLPGVERLPWLQKLMPNDSGTFAPGNRVTALPLRTQDGHTWQLGTIICYEDILPSFLRRVGALHPDLLVNLTNDTWFGEESEPWQHLALAVFGSVEQRTSMVRAVNSGVSAFIDPSGRVIKSTYAVDPYLHPTPADHALAAVPLLKGGFTIYQLVGNLFGYSCMATLALLLLLSAWHRTRAS